MIIDTHCHFDMMPNPEAFIRQWEKAGDIVIGMTNLPSHFEMGFSHVGGFRHIRLALGLHPLLAAENKREITRFKRLVDQTSYIGEIGLDFSREGVETKEEQVKVLRELLAVIKEMTVSKNGRSIIEKIPRNRILTETDTPYNDKADIKKALFNMSISETEVHNNFCELIARIR